jgi:hypothetical protein
VSLLHNAEKLSMGLTPKQVARLEGMASTEVESLVVEPDFKALIDGYRALHAMPEDEQRRILTQLARHLLMEATALGDVRVATFVILQERMGKDPARTLADGVIAAARRAPAPAPAPRTSPRPARPLDDPDLRAMQRVESRLRGELQQEHAAVHAAVAADGAPPVAEEAEPEPPQRQRRSPRPSSTPVLSDYQSRAIEVLLLLKNAAPDEQPTPRAQAP